MKKLTIWLFTCFILVAGQASAQTTYQSHTWQNGRLDITTTTGILCILPTTDKIVEVSFLSSAKAQLDSSHAVILPTQKPKTTLKDSKLVLVLKTKDIYIAIGKVGELKVSFSYKNKAKLIQLGGLFKRDTLQGFQFDLVADKTLPEEALYGAGSRALPLNRRGKLLLLYNNPHYGYEDYAEALNFSIPLVMSSRNYMLFFDNATKGYMDLGATDKGKVSLEAIAGKMTYYFIAGENTYDMLESYTALTGRQPLPPQWALGNFASRYGYHTETETRNILTEFEKQDIPVSAVILDHYWYGEGAIKKSVAMGDLDWYKPKFPNGAKMVADFKQKGIETVLITQPFMLTNSINYEETKKMGLLATDKNKETFVIKNFYFGETGILDIFKTNTQKWYWNKYKNLIDQGVQGMWGDLGEPETHPDAIYHLDGKAKAQEVHNIYGHYWAKTIHEGFKRDYPKIRPFILMRSGFAGSQRFGLIPWSGDVGHSWKGFRGQPALALSMGLCGIGYMHADAGGFAGGRQDDELYVRWLQYSLFQPIFRPHCQEQVPSEPVMYGEPTKSIAREIVKWRYRLLPYNQTLAYENSKTGKPLMRPLWVVEPNNAELYNIADTYFWGRDFLVAPVMDSGAVSRKIYLTKGDVWYDFFTGEKHKGGQWIEKKLFEEVSLDTKKTIDSIIQGLPKRNNYSIRLHDMELDEANKIYKHKYKIFQNDKEEKATITAWVSVSEVFFAENINNMGLIIASISANGQISKNVLPYPLDVTNRAYFPVFVRGGTCLLTLPDDRLAQKYDTDKLNLTYFVAGKDAKEEEECNYYLEKSDKDSNLTEAGFIQIEAEKAGEIEIKAVIPKDLQNAQNGFLKKNRAISLTIRGLENLPANVTLNGKKLVIIQMQEARTGDGYWHPSEKTLQFSFDWKAGEEVEIKWK